MIRTTIAALLMTSGLWAQPGASVFSAAGTDADALRTTVDDFRAALGAPLNPPGATGDPNGRREINWDGVGAQFLAPNNFPEKFFNQNSVRGMVLSSSAPGWTGFQVSANQGEGPVRFENLSPDYPSVFTVFSPQKLFTSVGSHVYDIDFFVPGTETPGLVNGFGAVFTNVAIPFTTMLEFFSPEGVSLGRYFARVHPKGLAFVGVVFKSKMVAKVRVTQGTTAPGVPDDPAAGINIVAVDDFLYGEPANRCVQ